MDEYLGVTQISDILYDFCSCEQGKENVVLVFFHGIALDQPNDRVERKDTPFNTWTFMNADSKQCWPSVMFKEDKYLEGKGIVVRALTVVYDSSKFKTGRSGRLDVYLVAELFNLSIISELIKKQIPIILVAHSFGGFVVQELIKHAFDKVRISPSRSSSSQKEFLKRVGGVFFYATPFGSLTSETFDHFFPDVIRGDTGTEYSSFVELLKTFNKTLARGQSEFPNNLKAIAKDYRGGKPIEIKAVFEVNETTVGNWEGVIVEEASGRLPGVSHSIQGADHFNICKPAALPHGFKDLKYQSLRDFVEQVISNFA